MPTRSRLLLAAACAALAATPASSQSTHPTAAPNDNRRPAGTIRDGVLTVALEARRAVWHPDGDSLPGIEMDAFAEAGAGPTVPGPLLRAPAGTTLRLSIRNALARDTLTFHLPAGLRADGAADSVRVAPGATGWMDSGPLRPGNLAYHASTSRPIRPAAGFSEMLGGALVVDPPGAGAGDRVFVLQLAADTLAANGFPVAGLTIFSINGRAWPHTERLDATAGDTIHWRVVNASVDAHPMHLHGFYFRVDALSGAQPPQMRGVPGRMVVTERLPAFAGMAMTWVPERAGNWVFHCHIQSHVAPHRPLGPATRQPAHTNHALTGMSGLVMGIRVRPRAGEGIANPGPGRRRLRLVAVRDSGYPDSLPSMRFVLEERDSARRAERSGFSPTIVLRRGEPVSITVVNQLDEPTAVHWHGIELESYFDGVAGFSGFGRRITPVVEPRDSFEARFTPPRAGTFMYHSHVNEQPQHRAGLLGALIVREPSAPVVAEDLVFFLKGMRGAPDGRLELNGQVDPDTTVMRVGRSYRLRFIGLQSDFPNATVSVTTRADSVHLSPRPDPLVLSWVPVAKDGADVPAEQRVAQPARQIVSMGETYDFELTPAQRGSLRLEVRAPGQRGRLLVRVPLRVE